MSLCLANHSLQVEAERVLYSAIMVFPPAPQTEYTKICFDTLLHSVGKAALVRSFTFSFGIGAHKGNFMRKELCELLPMLSNLRHLDLRTKADEETCEVIIATLR